MHRVLQRQIRRLGLSTDTPPEDVASWKQFLERVDGFYANADRQRYLMERSLRVSSHELLQANEDLRDHNRDRLERSEAHYRDLFRQTLIPTWEENFQTAALMLAELRDRGVDDLESYLRDHPETLTEIVTAVEIVDVNPAVAELVRSEDPSTLIGPVDSRLVSEQNTPAWIAQLMTIWEQRGSLRIEHLVGDRLDGEVFHGILEWHAPFVGGEFDYSRVVVSIVDITDRIIAEERMQEILKSKDEFLASVSHELRTPLTSVLGFAEVLRSMEHGSDDEKESLLEIIATQALDLSNIVEDLLVAARAELGQLSVISVGVDVHAQIAQVAEARGVAQKQIDLPERPRTPVRVAADPERVRQILRNLLTNAERYGGPQVRIEVEPESPLVAVRVRDNGPGLNEAVADRVFERYYRDSPGDAQPGSVGIGLTISRDLARMMGGNLYYERSDGWTAFTLELDEWVGTG